MSHEAAHREILEETGIDVTSPIVPFGFCEMRHSGIQQHKIVMLSHAQAEGEPQETEEGKAGQYTYEEAEHNMLEFTKEAIRIWKEKKPYFRLTEEQVDVRGHKFI